MTTIDFYCGLTVGPIFKTIDKARKTREIWAASYMFSDFIRMLCQELIAEGIAPEQFLVPYVKDSSILQRGSVGLLPDQIVFKCTEQQLPLLGKAIESIETQFIEDYGLSSDFYKHYMKKHFLQVPVESIKGNALTIIKGLLTQTEFFESVPLSLNNTDVFDFFAKVTAQQFYKTGLAGKRFPSLIEISANDFKNVGPNGQYSQILSNTFKYSAISDPAYKEEEDLWLALNKPENWGLDNDTFKKNIKPHFRAYHKYIAIVHADGDNMGKLLGKIFDEGDDATKQTNLDLFASSLQDFGAKAAKIISEKHGHAVYIGGDDLMFFAPVAYRNKEGELETIFDTIDAIDLAFDEAFKALNTAYQSTKDFKKPCITYGINMSYYKFPLNEALEMSYELMEKYKTAEYTNRNNVGFQLLKHSGQGIPGRIDKNKTLSRQAFKDMLHAFGKLAEKDVKFLNGINYKLSSYEDIFEHIWTSTDTKEQKEAKTSAFFFNSFDEGIHKTNEAFIKQLVAYICAVFDEYLQDKNMSVGNALEYIYATMRFIHFLNAKNENDEQ